MKRACASCTAVGLAATLSVASLAAFVTLVTTTPLAASVAESLSDAARDGDLDAVRTLIDQGADVNALDEDRSIPLVQAILAGNDEIVDVLIAAGADPGKPTDVDPRTLRERGAQIEPDARPQLTPLMIAVFFNNRAAAERLVKAGADVKRATEDGLKALHMTAFNPDGTIAAALIDGGANVNTRSTGSAGWRTPLHWAAERGNLAVADALLARGAEVNAMDERGRTPLDMADAQSHEEVVRLLTDHGAVASQNTVNANVDVAGNNPRLRPLVESEVLDRVASAGPRPLGIALDTVARKLFWTEFNTDSIRRADLDGSNAETISSSDLNGPIGIAVDAHRRTLYWTTDNAYPRRIQRSELDGAETRDVDSGPTVNRPSAIAVDHASGSVYWTESIAGRIRRANPDGSDIEDLLTSGISSQSDRPDAREFKSLGIAVDGTGRKLYWTEMLDAHVLRADLDGSNVETIVDASAGLALPAGIAVDRDRLYWTDAGAAKIQRAKLDGSGIEDVLTADDGIIEPYALALDHDAGRLYWSDAGNGTINSATLDGEDARTVLALTSEPSEASTAHDRCADAGTRYVRKAVNAIGTCLQKVDALKAVWRRQSDAARAAAACLEQLDRLAGGADPSRALEGELRVALEGGCGPIASASPSNAYTPLDALLAERCQGYRDGRAEIDCIAAAYRDIAYSHVAVRFRRAGEWLDEVRPFMPGARNAGAAGDVLNARANLDALAAALRTMTPQARAPAGSTASAGGQPAVAVTGQTTSYAATRKNGDRRWDAVPDDGAVRSGAPPRFLDNHDGTITDMNSGLMWEKKCDGCPGLHDMHAQYTLEPAEESASVASWLAAVNAEQGRGYGGHGDWRLPTVKELQSLVDYERFNPAAARAFDGEACGLGCTALRAPECSCTSMTAHCTATPIFGVPDRVFGLGFHLGIIGDVRKTQGCAVRAVRDARASGTPPAPAQPR